jgi:hypothetical protein
VYHEHFSYLSLIAVKRIFSKCGLRVFDVEKISTHGGSLRVYGCLDSAEWITTENVDEVIQDEIHIGMRSPEGYNMLQTNAEAARNSLLEFLLNQRKMGYRVVGYGAAAKGNTLLNFAGVKTDLVSYVVDGAVAKQNKFLPGSHIPVLSPAGLDLQAGDNVVIFPWNIAAEVSQIIIQRFGNKINIWTPIPTMEKINHS